MRFVNDLTTVGGMMSAGDDLAGIPLIRRGTSLSGSGSKSSSLGPECRSQAAMSKQSCR